MQRVSSRTDNQGLLLKVGQAIRAIRKEKGISQEALADAATIDRSHLGRIERGERNLTVLNLAKIAHALNAKVSEILREAGE